MFVNRATQNETVVTETMMPVNGIEVCAETFGEPTDPNVLLIAGAGCSMDWWDDEFCRRLAAGGRHVIRYDHRDTGRSTSFPAGAPPYSWVDLGNDALGVLDAYGVHRAHLVGFCAGGLLAQRIAIERPHRVLSLTLIATGPDGAVSVPESEPAPDWSDRRTAASWLAAQVQALGGPFTASLGYLRRFTQRVVDRTRDMAATGLNHRLAEPGPPLHDRLSSIGAPALILQGTLDPVVESAHAQALAAQIPGARLGWLEGMGHEFPPSATWSTVIEQILAQPEPRRLAA